MPVQYEEVEGSPFFEFARDRAQAVRVAKIAWDDIPAFLEELLPVPGAPYLYAATYPGFPWLKVSNVRIDPFIADGMAGDGLPVNTYPAGAKVTVTYEPPKRDVGKNGPSGTGGSPTGGEQQDGTFLTHSITGGGEFAVLPPFGMKWASDNAPVTASVEPRHIIPVVNHTLSWNYVARPPWFGMRIALGTTNDRNFAGAQKGTLLFVSFKASQDFTVKGLQLWKLEYDFSEKSVDPLEALNNNAKGWNYFMRPGPNTWDKILKADGNPIYSENTNFQAVLFTQG